MLTWRFALSAAALGVWISVGISGGHINPAVCFHQLYRMHAISYVLVFCDFCLLGDTFHGCLPRTSMVQGSYLHHRSMRWSMARFAGRFRKLLESHQYLRGW
jgi:Major intrinsic protein